MLAMNRVDDYRPEPLTAPWTAPPDHPLLPVESLAGAPNGKDELTALAARVAQLVIEVWAGRRGLQQIAGFCDADSVAQFEPMPGADLRLASVRIQQHRVGQLEVTARVNQYIDAVLHCSLAMAFRLVNAADSWTCTQLTLATPGVSRDGRGRF